MTRRRNPRRAEEQDLEARAMPRMPAGFDPLVAGKPRWSAIMPSFKAPAGSLPAFISTTAGEAVLGLWLELHPMITQTGRVDVTEAAARRFGLKPVKGFDLLCPILAVADGEPFHYLPDAAARWKDGSPVLAEAGMLEHKTTIQSRAAFAAARDLLATDNGHFFVLLEDSISRGWYRRALALHLWRFAYFAPLVLLDEITSAWEETHTPRALISRFKRRSSPQNVLHAVMKAAGDALAAGRLKVDLRRTEVDLDTPLRVLPRGATLILPPPLLDDVPADAAEPSDIDPDPTAAYIRPDALPIELAAQLVQRKADMQAMEEGRLNVAEVALRWGVGVRRVQQIKQRYDRLGDPALLPYLTTPSRRGLSTLDPRIKRFVKRRLMGDPRRTALDLVQDPELAKLCDTHGLRLPTRRRVARYMQGELSTQVTLPGRTRRSRSLPVHEKVTGFTANYRRPGFIVEADEAIGNLAAQLVAGTPLTDRIHEMRLNDVATKAPLSLVVSPRTVDAGDLRRVLYRAARPKDALVAAAGCEKDWPVRVWPMVLRLDNAWIGLTHMHVRVLPELGVMLEYAPARRPQAKSTAESAIGRDQTIHEDRQPNTTKGDVLRRGALRPEEEAARRAITPAQIESDLVRLTVDVVFHGFDKQARMRRSVAWSQAVEQYGVRTWEGGDDQLVQRLQHPIGNVTYHSAGVRYNGRDYVNKWAGDADDDPRRQLPYPVPSKKAMSRGQQGLAWIDQDDVRTIDIFDPATAEYRGALVTNYVSLRKGRAVSESELQFERLLTAPDQVEADREGQAARDDMRRKNESLPPKRVARAIAQVTHKVERRREAVGLGTSQAVPRPKPTPTGKRRRSGPKTLTARPGQYAPPSVEVSEE